MSNHNAPAERGDRHAHDIPNAPVPRPRRHRSGKIIRRFRHVLAFAAIAIPAAPQPVFANNYGESLAWQFKTSADRVNQAAILDLIEKRRGGYYAAPIYTTNIARQYNCSVAATATGNSGAQTALANSPSVTGATSSATGNSNATSTTGDGTKPRIDSGQANNGTVSSGVNGSTGTTVHGAAWQTLNSTQANSGNQTATVQGSNACAFGALN